MTLPETIARQVPGIHVATAQEVLDLLRLFGLVDPVAIARQERDSRIYDLRSQMTEADLAARFDMTPRRVRQIIQVQMTIRRG